MRQTRGAIIREAPGKLEVVDLLVDDPQPDEVQVKLVASGMCHSDDHHVTGDLPVGMFPFALGHEGAGIVTKVGGPNYKGIEEGDHVVFSAIPGCGHCRWCATGQSSLCDLAAGILAGPRWTDGTCRLRLLDGTPVGQMCGISTFAETTTVAISSVVKVAKDLPLDKVCLVGCGVSTGWGPEPNVPRAHARALVRPAILAQCLRDLSPTPIALRAFETPPPLRVEEIVRSGASSENPSPPAPDPRPRPRPSPSSTTTSTRKPRR